MLDANRDISIKLAGARAQKKCLKIKFYAIKLKSMRQAEKNFLVKLQHHETLNKKVVQICMLLRNVMTKQLS